MNPAIKRGNQWYVFPVREPEYSLSFKVNAAINRWYDYALMQGSKLFDLAERIYPNQDTDSLVEKINQAISSSHGRLQASALALKIVLKIKLPLDYFTNSF
ncbi:hypothetical protein [Dyadobacter sediminis]|uniref:Zinc finger CHC2-type domain-containing protein n=1 Tax=Dyadobacter sediminis TaxID=1493691 RepID=A0A5R9KDV0_9BACT|nr:hypothetical protein [Dyadobacter sediminis]TLU94299.1 hypothetical protein FEM55_08585 [Dyadobacter sediminis]